MNENIPKLTEERNVYDNICTRAGAAITCRYSATLATLQTLFATLQAHSAMLLSSRRAERYVIPAKKLIGSLFRYNFIKFGRSK